LAKFENTVFAFASSHYLMYNIFFHNLSKAEEALDISLSHQQSIFLVGEDALQVKNNPYCKRRFE